MEQLADGAGDARLAGEALISRLSDWLRTHDAPPVVTGARRLSWIFLAVSVALSSLFFFSNWAVGSEAFNQAGFDLEIVSAVVFASALYLALAFCCVVAVLMLRAMVRSDNDASTYFFALLIGIQPMVYLLWLQAR